MKFFLLSVGVLVVSLSAPAEPGGTYVLTGREKSIFGIFQADTKAHWELYKGEDINTLYQEFRKINNLEGRKLQRGETLTFPHTKKSKQLAKAEKARAERAAREAEAAAARDQAKLAGSGTSGEADNQSELFGSDTRAPLSNATPEELEKARIEAEKKSTRYRAVKSFQRYFMPRWIFKQDTDIITEGSIAALVALAEEKVDGDFAKALKLHSYPEKNIYIIEFEKPQIVGELLFFAILREGNGVSFFYSLEKGIRFFGAGEAGVLREWQYGVEVAELGGRKYNDLAGFLNELEAGRPTKAGVDSAGK